MNTSASLERLIVSNSVLPGQSFTVPYKNSQKSLLARVDDQMTSKDRLTIRGSRWDQDNPFVRAGRPSLQRVRVDAERDEPRRHLVEGAERHQGAGSAVRVQQLRLVANAARRARAPSSTTSAA